MYAMSIRDGDAREYDPSQYASQKRRKTRMRRALIGPCNSTKESGAQLLFRLPKSAGGNRKHLK